MTGKTGEKKRKEGKKTGRPTVMTAEKIRQLEEGFSRGLNVVQACLYAGVSKDAFYDHCRRYPEFSDRMNDLRHAVTMRAALNIDREVKAGSVDVSKWLLERRCRDEYSPKIDGTVTISGGLSLQDKEQALADFLGGFLEE